MNQLIKDIVKNFSVLFKEHNKTIAEIKDFKAHLLQKASYPKKLSEFIKFIDNEINHFLAN